MTDTSPRLALPYILPSQAQKHVTHNEALLALDAVTQLVIEDSLTAAPTDPVDGACYWVTSTATGTWAGKEGRIAAWQDSSWAFLSPSAGWRAYFRVSGLLRIHDGSTWQDLALPDTATFKQLGVNASADATNRLAVSSDATLFNHAGGDMRLKLNKAGQGNTATLLYQSNWQGRAEMGLAGSDQFSLKVCNDAGNWTTALLVTGDGYVTQPARPAARAELNSPSLAISSGMLTGFNGFAFSQGNIQLSTPIGSGNGQTLKVPVAGIYLVALTLATSSTAGYAASLVDASRAQLLRITFGTTTGTTEAHGSALLSLEAGAELCLSHSGSAMLAASGMASKLSIYLI
ncbi:DUF2793 domain-containing protein [Allorhizobium taibaishanense]|uniref:DUF2793 domain-containing protein n=1 Tax=Allorhizobium taibaishanense TaxID=887144 RepID=A0A1Q9A4T0_9HYPH|nr:DUF2793 domain-containing protein [Allorhizobium taibaishanense]MBB4006559.1 hypothetical protein [Allorhizobium taibaishanense]OLP49487.1 hypothetical protein BJF91_20870 [Allorhizobium taibaishanense]